MALFQYRAYSESGKVIRRIIDADSFDAAKDRLRTMQLPVIDVKPLHRTTENLKLSSGSISFLLETFPNCYKQDSLYMSHL